MKKKGKLSTIIGAISASLGIGGAALAGCGAVTCTLAPILSIAGVASLITGFLVKSRAIFITIGIILLTISLYFYKKRRICKVHGKNG